MHMCVYTHVFVRTYVYIYIYMYRSSCACSFTGSLLTYIEAPRSPFSTSMLIWEGSDASYRIERFASLSMKSHDAVQAPGLPLKLRVLKNHLETCQSSKRTYASDSCPPVLYCPSRLEVDRTGRFIGRTHTHRCPIRMTCWFLRGRGGVEFPCAHVYGEYTDAQC